MSEEMNTAFHTPSLKTPITSRTRRKALSPPSLATPTTAKTSKSEYSSPYEVINLDLPPEEYKTRVVEQDGMIRELQQTVKKIQKDYASGINESILIETSNRISTQEGRVHRRDVDLLMQEVENLKKQLIESKAELQLELKKRHNVEYDMKDKMFNAETLNNELQEKLRDLELKLAEKRGECNRQEKDFTEAKINYKSQIISLECKINKCREDLKDERRRNSELVSEMNLLKASLREAREELRQRMDDTRRINEDFEQKEIELRHSLETSLVDKQQTTSNHLLNEFKTLSTHIISIQKNHPGLDLSETQLKIANLSASNMFMEEKLKEQKGREEELNKQLEEEKEKASCALSELNELRKKLLDIEGNAELTHAYLVEDGNRVRQQKADIRCELFELRREHSALQAKLEKMQSATEAVESGALERLRREITTIKDELTLIQKETQEKDMSLKNANDRIRILENDLCSARDELEVAMIDRSTKAELRDQIARLEANHVQRLKDLETIDDQCDKLLALKKQAEAGRQRAQQECTELTSKVRELETRLATQRASDAALMEQKAERERLEHKIRYLNDELRETHTDYREELARLARQISESKHKDNTDNKEQSMKVETLTSKLTQQETTMKTLKRQVEELKEDNQKLQARVSQVLANEHTTVDENTRLRKGLSDAVAKIEEYKRQADDAKELNHSMAQQLAEQVDKMADMEEEIGDLREIVKEKERLEAYLQSQINAKQMPKVSRRSTLLRTCSENSMDSVSQSDLDELENERTQLKQQLEEKRRKLNEKKEMPPPKAPRHHQPIVPSAPPQTPKSASQIALQHKRTPLSSIQSKSTGDVHTPSKVKGIMRHDIPHKWKELRHLGIFSIKCAVCFVGVSTFGKAKRCHHCEVIVHSQCASKVVNTCGLPDKWANYYLDTHCTPSANGRMNGWLKMFRDDTQTDAWLSVWGQMEEKKLSFYDNDAVQNDLTAPIMEINLERDEWIVRAGNSAPIRSEDDHLEQANSIIHIKMNNRNIYLLAPSIHSARRWAEALQTAHTRRMLLSRRPSSFSDRSCLLVLQHPNNLTIHATCVLDDYLLIGAQSGLFFTQMSNPRVPVRIQGVSAVTAMELMTDINMLVLVVGAQRNLAFLPISSLRSELRSSQPSVRTDSLPGFDHLHLIISHKQNGQRYICVADTTFIHILKYNSSRDMFVKYQAIRTCEPTMCLQSTDNGFYYGSDSFYFVEMNKAAGNELVPTALAASHVADYPIAVLPTSQDEVLLAYQNHGIFVNSRGERTRRQSVEWEQMPMEFVYTAPYLYVVHYDSVEIMQIAEYQGLDSQTIIDEREVFECKNAHMVGKGDNGDVYMSVSSKDSVEVHRFNATSGKRSGLKRKGISLATFNEKKIKT